MDKMERSKSKTNTDLKNNPTTSQNQPSTKSGANPTGNPAPTKKKSGYDDGFTHLTGFEAVLHGKPHFSSPN